MQGTARQLRRRTLSWICESCQLGVSSKRNGINGASRAFTASTSTRSKHTSLPDGPARTRFAPSPTGNLHLGSIRTALFNYLLAKRTQGDFLLRIEDTDQKRTVQGAEERLYDDLRWAGLQWDEGPGVGGPYGPYRQSERLDIYQGHAAQLLTSGHAYRCFCSQQRIDELNRLRHAKGLQLGYDRKCMHMPRSQAEEYVRQGQSHVVRFKAPEAYPQYQDLVYGKTGHGAGRYTQRFVDAPVYDDPVLMKSDSFPTYHFANIVDDHLMHITHVVRGSEWMSSTPMHVALYHAFGWQPPQFAHVPLLVDEHKQKLSKRKSDTSISNFRDKLAIWPETLTNFAALLGWSHKEKSDVMDLARLEQLFDLNITKGNTMVAMGKLYFLQEQHARRRILTGGEALEQMIRDVAVAVLDAYGAAAVSKFIGKRKLRDVLAGILQTPSLTYQNPQQYAAQLDIFFTDTHIKNRPPLNQALQEVKLYHDLTVAASAILCIPENQWNREVIKENLKSIDFASSPTIEHESDAYKKKSNQKIWAFLRWALLGGVRGPEMAIVMELLGRDVCEARIREAVLLARHIQNGHSKPNI